jgi:glycine cleavage system transcriptional repressor
MPHLLLSALGRDQPGIVATLTGVLLRHGANLEDSQMTILRGHFAVMLILAVPDEADRDALASDLEATGNDLGLEALVLREVAALDPAAPEPSHIVTVYGLDHPGIVHGAKTALAERGIDITDLNNRLLEEEGEETIYALMMEVAVPDGRSSEELREALDAVGTEEQVEVSLRELEQDAL